MEHESQNLQYAGRRRAPSEEEAQAMGRTHVASDALYVESEATSFSAPKLNYPAAPPKRRLSKRLIAIISSAAGLILVLSVIGLIAGLSGQRNNPDNHSVEAPTSTPDVVEPSESTPTGQPKVTEIPAATPIGDGEFLYTGHLELDQAEYMLLSFVLSADLSYIHDIKLEITNLSASVQNGNTTTTVSVSNLTETYSGEYPVDFYYGGRDVQIGRSNIRNVDFYEDCAYVELDYVYFASGVGGDGGVEIPLGSIYGVLMAETAPESAGAGSVETIPPEGTDLSSTQTVFDYDKLKNWKDELPGGGYGFEPAAPQAKHYIICVNTVIDPKTGMVSEGGYENNFTRHKPVSTDDVLYCSGRLNGGGLILTDAPDLATYALIITFVYDRTGTFTFDDGSVVTQYHGATNAELYNLVTGESIYTGDLKTFATYTNESVYTAMLDNAKGKQLYAQSSTIDADDFTDYWDFIQE